MIMGKSVVAIIPARGGSKGVPRKNIRLLGSKPLIAWTITEAIKSSYIDRLILSSEDEEIINIATVWGCEVPFVRPPELSQDDTPGIAPVVHAINALGASYDYTMLLQPTSPFRKAESIDRCIEAFNASGMPACASISKATDNPHWMYQIEEDMSLRPYIKTVENYCRRQDLPPVYKLNGAMYIAETEYLLESLTFLGGQTLGFAMDEGESLDIDTEMDLAYCEFLLHLREK